MAKVFIEESTLTAIGDAIRGKEGTTELVPVTDMATRITDLPSGGGGGNEPTAEELTITGDCSYRFGNNGWDWFINKYGDRITTKDITHASHMFENCTQLKSIPFSINVNNAYYYSCLLYKCEGLTQSPKIRGTIQWNTVTDFSDMIDYCSKWRNVDDLFTPDMLDGFSTVKVTSQYSCPKRCTFSYNYSLRTIPSWWYKFKLNPESTVYPTNIYTLYSDTFNYCYTLDEALNIPVWTCTAAQTNDMFSSFCKEATRLKNLTFETNEDGTAIETKWTSQIIDLTNYVGYSSDPQYILAYNSGITAGKRVTDAESYQRLKNDPDWFTTNKSYSRYNHDSAVATINSLPDTSAYLASAGGTNTIKFKGAAGALTDGGAINTLTEAEIAVAAAKGWTVTFA